MLHSRSILLAALVLSAMVAPLARGQETAAIQQVQVDVVMAELRLPRDEAAGIIKALVGQGKRVNHEGGRCLVWVARHPHFANEDLVPLLIPGFEEPKQRRAKALNDDLLRRLRTRGMLEVLGCPKIVTFSGRPANFLSGQKLAVPAKDDGSVSYVPFGHQVNILPIVLPNGNISVETEIFSDQCAGELEIDSIHAHGGAALAKGQMLFSLTASNSNKGGDADGTLHFLLCIVRPELVQPH